MESLSRISVDGGCAPKIEGRDKNCFRISSLRVILLSGIKARRSVGGGGQGGEGQRGSRRADDNQNTKLPIASDLRGKGA